MWMTSEPGSAIPSIAIDGSQTAAIRMWFLNASTPIGFSKAPAGSFGGGTLGPPASPADGGITLDGEGVRLTSKITATPIRIPAVISGPAQRRLSTDVLPNP